MRKILLILLALTLLPVSMTFGADSRPAIGMGGFYNGVTWEFVSFTGFETSIYVAKDSLGEVEFETYMKTQYFFVDSEEDIQGVAVWQMYMKPVTGKFYAAFGLGVTYEIVDGENIANAGLKLEPGFCVDRFKIYCGYEHIPKTGNDFYSAYGGFTFDF